MKIAKPSRHPLLCLGLLVVLSMTVQNQAVAQQVYRDYVTDRNAQYSPFDYQQRGLVYRFQTGHAGIFGQCDNDRQKMVSPYIDWHCRSSNSLPTGQFSWEIISDLFRKKQRHEDGACGWGGCARCNRPEAHCQCDDFYEESPNVPAPTVPASDLRPQLRNQGSIQYRPNERNLVPPSNAPKSSFSKTSGPIAYSALARQKQTPVEKFNRGLTAEPPSRPTNRKPVTSGRINDPRYRSRSKRVPENQFDRHGEPYSAKPSRNTTPFRLSGGRVFSQTESSSATPDQGQQSGPQYFQFQQIGGSANR